MGVIAGVKSVNVGVWASSSGMRIGVGLGAFDTTTCTESDCSEPRGEVSGAAGVRDQSGRDCAGGMGGVACGGTRAWRAHKSLSIPA